MPREEFPLSKNRSVMLGSSWRWCISHIEAEGVRYRLLVAFNQGKEQYLAWLALQVGSDQAVLARLEYHPDHRYWHCHLKQGSLSEVARGVVKEAGRRERCWLCHAGGPLAVSELDALGIAFRVFGVEHPFEDLGPFP